MPLNDDHQNDEREMRRRDWAARQNPELVTTKQAIEMFGRVNFPNFKDFLSDRGIGAKIIPGFRGAYFYDKATIKIAADEYLIDHPPSSRVGKRYEPKPEIQTTTSIIKKLPESRWSLEAFIEALSYDYESDAAVDIARRAPSIRYLSPMDAYDLIKLLLHLNGQRHKVIGGRYDIMHVRKALIGYVKSKSDEGSPIDQADVSFVRDFIFSAYNTTDIGVFDPEVSVAVLFELRLSRDQRE